MPEVKKQNFAGNANPGLGNILSRIKPIGFDEDEGIKCLIYGRSGTGKTTIWATFPKPILSIVISGGNKPGELRSIDTVENRKVISSISLETSAEIPTLINYAVGKFKTVVVDHITGFQDRVLSEVVGKPLPEQKSWGLVTQQQYGQATMQCKELLREILSLPLNVVLVAQERTFDGVNSDGGGELIAPSVGANLMPQFGGWVNCAVDYIVNTFIRNKTQKKIITVGTQKVEQTIVLKEPEYCLRTGPDATYTTKFRVPKGHKLPDVLVDPNYQKIMNLIRGVSNTPASAVKPGGK